MSRSSRNPPPTGAPATRQNEYFVPRDGIDREVISADICRYLGNDALVRPGNYENPQTGQVVQGYYITAYRNLTTAMIEDLKADSARWDSERRAQTRSTGVQYRSSVTHQSRQHHGPTESPYQSDLYREAGYDGGPRYPGTGAPGYTGAAGSSYPQQGYASTSSGAYGGYPPPQQSPPPSDPRYASTTPQGSSLNQGFQPPPQDPYVTMGANRTTPRGYAGDGFANPANSAATTGASESGYSAVATSPYPYSTQVPQAGAQSYGAMQQPQDPFYGRGQSSQQAYAAQGQQQQQQQQQQYDEPPRTRTSATPTNTQTNPSGSSSRRSDRESDRQHSDRHHRSSRR